MSSPDALFGSNSDGAIWFMEWLDFMCAGCKHENAGARKDGLGGGVGCRLADSAYCDAGDDIPEWLPPGKAPYPDHCAAKFSADRNPWPVCTAYERRKKRSDAGRPRVPAGQEALL